MSDTANSFDDHEHLERLSHELRGLLKERGTLRRYGPGEVLMAPGDDGRVVRFLLTGEAHVVMAADDDSEISLDTLATGDMFGEISLFTGRPTPSKASVTARELCEVVEVPADTFMHALREQPELSVTVLRSLAEKVIRLNRSLFVSNLKSRALQSLVSTEEEAFPDYVIGEYIQTHVAVQVQELAYSPGPILVMGETGVGKEVLAHAVYKIGDLYKDVFLLVDLVRSAGWEQPRTGCETCSDSDKDAVEEQLRMFFGAWERKADGKHTDVAGYLEMTRGGTLLIRGAERLTPVVQKQLLEAIRKGTFRREGGDRVLRSDLRIVLTTEVEWSEVDPRTHPLLYGLRDRCIAVPPLRKRRREIPAMVKYYVERYGRELRKPTLQPTGEIMRVLVDYPWPGNDRELSATIKRAILVSEGGILRTRDFYFNLRPVERQGKFNLLRLDWVRRTLKSPMFPALLQGAVTPGFFAVLVLFFLGPADPMANPAALLSWGIGWPTLVVTSFFWGRFWCTICPIGAVSWLFKKIYSFERPFPTILKKHSELIITGAILFIIWFETATGIRNSPFNVGVLLLTMLLSAIVVAMVFERQSWCRYMCGLGGIVSVLSKASVLELRTDRNVCISQCNTNECYLGTDTNPGCPFGVVAATIRSNRFCKLCGICVKNCPHDAVALNLRIPGKELWEVQQANASTAFLIVGMTGGLLTEMISKVPAAAQFMGSLPVPHIARFTVLFAAVLVGINLMLALAAFVSGYVLGDGFRDNYSRYGIALLPVALAGFLAFHIYYLFTLGVRVPSLIGSYLDLDVLRTLVITIPPGFSQLCQQMLVWSGLAWSLLIIFRIARGSRDQLWRAVVGLLPHGAVAVVLAFSLLESMRWFFYG